MSEQSTTMKLSITNSQELRRSPRLNPQPRRSPRIKELDVARPTDTTPDRDAKEEGVVVRRRSAGSRSSMSTPPSNNDAMATPKSKSTSKKSTSASAVKFRHNSVSQLFHSTDPASHVRRASGKRLFRTASAAEEQGHRSKRVKNGEMTTHEKRVIILARVLVALGTIIVFGSLAFIVKKVVMEQ